MAFLCGLAALLCLRCLPTAPFPVWTAGLAGLFTVCGGLFLAMGVMNDRWSR
jgi:hypothetical protein